MSFAFDGVTEEAVRDLLNLNDPGIASRFTSGAIGSNIRVASEHLEQWTGRQFHNSTGSVRRFTTNGQAYIPLPGLRNAGTVERAGSPLTADESYWLIPDEQQSGVYIGIQFRAFNSYRSDGPWYLHHSNWFDTNMDHRWYPGSSYSSQPNDLVFGASSEWGYDSNTFPEAARSACKVLAAFYTLQPDALLTGGIVTGTGSFDLSSLPLEVQAFVRSWRLGKMAVSVG